MITTAADLVIKREKLHPDQKTIISLTPSQDAKIKTTVNNEVFFIILN